MEVSQSSQSAYGKHKCRSSPVSSWFSGFQPVFSSLFFFFSPPFLSIFPCPPLLLLLSKTIKVKIIDDEEYEKNKTFYIEIGEPRLVESNDTKGPKGGEPGDAVTFDPLSVRLGTEGCMFSTHGGKLGFNTPLLLLLLMCQRTCSKLYHLTTSTTPLF